MNFKYLENKEAESALSEYLEILHCCVKFQTEVVSVEKAAGRITAKAVYAKRSDPDYYASAMDGIAVRSEITFGAHETNPVILGEADFVMIDTGDPIPEEFDAVIMIEDIVLIPDNKVKITSSVYPYQNVRQIGEDICSLGMLVPSRTMISASGLGALTAGGISEIEVIKKPKVAIIPTGDEIISPGTVSEKGKIIEFNSRIFSSYIDDWGGETTVYECVPDNKELLINALQKALDENDIVLINAGSSAGRDDYTSFVINTVGKVITHGVAIKPGKPIILGTALNKAVIGIPGYPVSGVICMRYFVKEVMKLWGEVYREPESYVDAICARKIVSSLKYKDFIRVRLGNVNNRLVAVPLSSGAGIITSYLNADGMLTIDKKSEGLESGTPVKIELLRPMSQVEKSILITGSHDPLLDEIDDLLRMEYPSFRLNSTHVGSMGGIHALNRRETNLAGIHLLDTETGEYNESYFDKYLNKTDFVMIKGFKRQQGILTVANSTISSLSDIAESNARFINRQKGSGTRIFFDYLLKQELVEPAKINGYNREAYTHQALAQQIEAGGADCGIGIFSAAKIYGLRFVPLAVEEYDFVMEYSFRHSDKGEAFLKILNSDLFIERMNQLGGYSR